MNENKCLYCHETAEEHWKPIIGFEGLYEISNLGRVKSLSRYVKSKANSKMKIPERILKTGKNKCGYALVVLMKNNKRHNKLVHRLVAEAFINNPENYAVVNHIDGNKQNNNVSNLEWCSTSYNVKHAYLTGLNKKIKAVIQLDLTGKIIRKYNSVRETEQYGYQSSGVSEACNGLKTNHTYRGFIWRFDNAI